MEKPVPWPCTAYQNEAVLRCFFTVNGVCDDLIECHSRMWQERARVYRAIQEQAAAGDEAAVVLAERIVSPDALRPGPIMPPGPEL